MPRQKLPRALKKCEREGCNNTFIIKVGARYQQRFCCPACAAMSSNKRRRSRKRAAKQTPVKRMKKKDTYTVSDLQELPVNFSASGGKFAEICNAILKGKLEFIGPAVSGVK